jgi:hypothetical protein
MATGKSKAKTKGGSGSAGDKRGGIAKAKEAAGRSGTEERAASDKPAGGKGGEGRGKGRD